MYAVQMRGENPMRIRGVILGAGKATRMGKDKLNLKLGDKAIIDMVIENAKASKLDELVLVYGKYDIDTDINKLYNADFEQGMSTSVKKGLEGFDGEAVMLLLGDMPYVTVDIINKLYDEFVQSGKNIAAPISNGRRGNPVIIGKKYFCGLLENTGDKGARAIISSNLQDVHWVEVTSNGIFIDIDDEISYNSIKA
jgi:molybdenum cofactor cytidylyltransferase